MDTNRPLSKVLFQKEIDEIPKVLKKIDKYLQAQLSESSQLKDLYRNTKSNIDKVVKDHEKLVSQQQDTKEKYDAAELNIKELRHQLDQAIACSSKLDELISEKEQLLKISSEKEVIINRLQLDMKSLEDKLQSSVLANNEVVAGFPTVKQSTIIRKLNETNQSLTSQCKSVKAKLHESVEIIESYKGEVYAKIKLADLYKAQVIELKADVKKLHDEMSRKLDEFVAERDSLEGKLNEITPKFENLERENAQLKCNQKENSINFNILNEQYGQMERKLRELHSVALQSQAKFANEKIESQQKDIIIYKEQIQTLEDRNQMYDKINQQHETAIKSLRDEILSNIQNLSTAQNRCEYLERELLRSDFECRVQMEKQWKDQVKFEKEEVLLTIEKEDAVNKMIVEHKQNERLRSKLKEAEAQNLQIKDLNEKLYEALTLCESDDPIVKRNKDLKLQVINNAAKIQQLQLELKEKVTKINEDNKRLKIELKASQLNETNLKSQIEELQEDIRNSQFNDPGAVSENQVQTELKASLEKKTKKDEELLELETEFHKEYLKFVKSRQVKKAYKTDSQAMTIYKDELNKCQEENHQLRSAVKNLTSSRFEWEAKSKELENKVDNLVKQNMELMKPAQEISPIPNDSTTNSSLIEEEFKENSSEKVSSSEKDIATHIENLHKENIRSSTKAVQKKQINQLSNVNLQGFNVIPKTEYEELLLNLKTLNAITDSNIHLRSEKIRLEGEIASNIERLQGSAAEQKKLQDKLDSLKQENAKLTLDLIDTKKPISMKDNKLKANLNKEDEMKTNEMEPSSQLPSTKHPNLVNQFNRGVNTPIASIKPRSSQNIQANGITSTAEALFSSSTISAIVTAPSPLVPDGSSVQSIVQHQASPLQNTSFTSEQVDDENAAASTPSSSLVSQKTMSSHQNESLSNEARTTQAGTKRPRDAEDDSQTNLEETSVAASSSVTATLRTKKRKTVVASMVQNVEDVTESSHGGSEGLASIRKTAFDSLKSAKVL